ncbi:MAG: UDP-N-acetylglucosamine 1-carboxyvinyltransferase, partial [Lentisphaeria bacterium]|nr:UDP-N-acetylglucosamine 1-carboxyvinyltransferase [Lentisphaeria bacterium]
MKSLIIDGPSKIAGTIVPGGNKNAALPIISACLLTDEEVVIHNMPDIVDVQIMQDLAACIGVKVERIGKTVKIHAKTVTGAHLPATQCARVRGSILFAGSVTYRCGEAHIGLPGGDFIGRRRLDSHYYGLRKLGISCDIRAGMADFSIAKKLRGSDMFLDEA